MRIVIVVNDVGVRQQIRESLEEENGWNIIAEADDGVSGFETVRRERPELVITELQMPGMDGLTMLRRLREEDNISRVIVVTSCQDFSCAREAIILGVDYYLLKPFRNEELLYAIALLEQRADNWEKGLYSLDRVIRAALSGHVDQREFIKRLLWRQYGYRMDEPVGIFIVRLGRYYDTYQQTVCESLKSTGENSRLFKICALDVPKHRMVLAVLFSMKSQEKVKDYLKKTIAPMLALRTRRRAAMGLNFCANLKECQKSNLELYEKLDYVLIRGMDTLICYDELPPPQEEQFPYSLDFTNRAKQAIAAGDRKSLLKCIREFEKVAQQKCKSPETIKEAYLRYGYAFLHLAKECGNIREEVSARGLIKAAMTAVTWEEMEEGIWSCFGTILESSVEKEKKTTTLLVKRAEGMIKEYYHQGITLEEIARELSVSEEYLSSQIKIETGKNFTEIIRALRIGKIKSLLLLSDMSINQIATEVGFSNAKYMSRVFRAETGMSPSEYRKINI